MIEVDAATDTLHYTARDSFSIHITGTNGCDTTVTIQDTTFNEPFNLSNITPDTTIAYGDTIRLNASGAYYYTWSPLTTLDNPNTNTPLAYPQHPTEYTVYGMSEKGCRDTAKMKVDINFTAQIIIPSAFSPNADGNNDVFRIVNIKNQTLNEFKIFNRWGKEIFRTTDKTKAWDGTYNGQPQEIGTYSYLINISFQNGTTKTYSGTTTLIR